MIRTILEGKRRRALLVFCVGALLALMVAVPAAYAAYRHDDGRIRCPKGQRPALIVKAKGNPVWVRAHASSGYTVIWDKYPYLFGDHHQGLSCKRHIRRSGYGLGRRCLRRGGLREPPSHARVLLQSLSEAVFGNVS